MKPSEHSEPVTLIDRLLAEQSSLTAVARFSREHEQNIGPVQERYYRDLLPLNRPKPGEQYAFEVDLDRCSGCKACVTACHSLNGLDDEETWRNVGLLHGGTVLKPVQQTITTACHHCVEPACAEGCPVLAYEKDPATGIVRHLDDQCIGCQYCVLKCPYDVPKYSERLGIVRKCDMCTNRLSSGEAPACVQACPSEAIRITVVEQAPIATQYRETVTATNGFLPGSPDPAYTLPTTRYKSARPVDSSLHAADAEELELQCAHTPLGFMLVLSQLSVGAFLVERCLSLFSPGATSSLPRVLSLVALVIGWAALAASTAHLGRPFGAWRAFLGLRRSWLSREIVVFGLFATVAPLHTAALWFPERLPAVLVATAGWATVVSGLVGVFCSAMIYHDTRREFWSLPRSAGKFFGTTALLGSVTALGVASWLPGGVDFIPALGAVVLVAGFLKLGTELPILRWLEREDFSPLHKTALLLHGRLGLFHRVRLAAGIAGGVLLPALMALGVAQASVEPRLIALAGTGCFVLCLIGELMERRLFFVAVQPMKMPGGVAA